jgi:hypothetical protein
VSGDPNFQPKMAAKLKIEKRGDEIIPLEMHFFVKFGCGGHFGRCYEMPDTILEEDHSRIISAKFG